MKIVHPIEPFYQENSKILILGSFPSVKSREQMFFYGHSQNRFWKVISSIFEEKTPNSIDEKKNLLKNNGIALWDVIHSCEISGSSDSSIKNVVPNDISKILENSNVGKIFVNGKTAKAYYDKYIKNITKRDAICLPSTSPANAAWSLDKLVDAWSQIKL